MEHSTEYQVRTVIYSIAFGLCVLLMVFQGWNLVLQYYPKCGDFTFTKSNPTTKGSISPFQLMFPLFASNFAFALALFFYLIAHLNWFSINCSFCDFTIPAGGILYVLGKCFLYKFFAVRASVSQGIIENFPKWLTKLFLPAFIAGVFVIYCICFPLFFKGDCQLHSNTIVDSYCNLGDYPDWMAWLGAVSDFGTNVMFVGIFAYPLYESYQMSEESFKNKGQNRARFIFTMKWNLVLSLITSVSTSMAMFGVAVYGHYWWLYTIDFPINGISSFFMIGANRRFLIHNIFCICYRNRINNENRRKSELSHQRQIKRSQSRTNTHKDKDKDKDKNNHNRFHHSPENSTQSMNSMKSNTNTNSTHSMNNTTKTKSVLSNKSSNTGASGISGGGSGGGGGGPGKGQTVLLKQITSESSMGDANSNNNNNNNNDNNHSNLNLSLNLNLNPPADFDFNIFNENNSDYRNNTNNNDGNNNNNNDVDSDADNDVDNGPRPVTPKPYD